MELEINKMFKELIPNLSLDEYNQLEKNIIQNGCIDTIKVWNNIIIDGHNRCAICTKNNIEYNTKKLEFDTETDVITWIINNQLGRRNISDFTKVELQLKKKNLLLEIGKANMSNASKGLSFGDKPYTHNTRTELAEEIGISTGKFAQAEIIIKEATDEIKELLHSGEITIGEAYNDIKCEKRKAKQQEIAASKVFMEIPETEFNVIYSDPPWSYDFNLESRAIVNHYPQMELNDIKNIKIPAAKDCVLFMWATAPKLEQAFEVIKAWGFEYKTCSVWDKQTMGLGYWFRGQTEMLLVATKGKISPPDSNVRERSLYSEKRTEHSVKPNYYYEMIESYFPNGKYFEMFARRKYNDKWTIWGNENV